MTADSSIHQISDTALWVATFRADETERDAPLFQDPYARMLAGPRGAAIAEAMPHANIIRWILLIRTLIIDRLIENALEDGVDTIVNIGAGLDSRPYRMNLPKDLRWFEVDVPEIIEHKTKILKHEIPKCRLERITVNFADTEAVRGVYRDIGANARKAFVITEGVIPYLTEEQAAVLAQNLYSIPSFHYWVQDFRNRTLNWKQPKRTRELMKNAPFLFDVPDTVEFFSKYGWKAKELHFSVDEGKRVNRPFPLPHIWKYLFRLMPMKKREEFRQSFGIVMFER